MNFLIDVLSDSLGYASLAAFLTLLGVFLMFFLIKSWRRNSQFTPISFIVGFILFLFLTFQSILVSGALIVKSYSDELESTVTALVQNIPESTHFTKEDSQEVLEYLIDSNPLVGEFVGGADFHGHTPSTLPAAMTDELKSFMNYYILRRMLWALFFVVTGVVLVLKTMDSMDYMRRKGGGTSSRGSRCETRSGGGARRGRFHD